MYKLFKIRKQSEEEFKSKLTEFIILHGSKKVSIETKDSDRIVLLIEFKELIRSFLIHSFEEDMLMNNTICSAFDKFISDSRHTTEDLVKYIDKMFSEYFNKNSD